MGPFRVTGDLQRDIIYMMRVHLTHVYVNRRTRVVDVGHPYPQIVAGTSRHPGCLTGLAAVAIQAITGTFDLPLAATCTLHHMSALVCIGSGCMSCLEQRTATLFRFLGFLSPRGDLDSSLSLPSG